MSRDMFRRYRQPVRFSRGVTFLLKGGLCRGRGMFWGCGQSVWRSRGVLTALQRRLCRSRGMFRGCRRSMLCSRGVLKALFVVARLFSVFTRRGEEFEKCSSRWCPGFIWKRVPRCVHPTGCHLRYCQCWGRRCRSTCCSMRSRIRQFDLALRYIRRL